MLCQLWPCIAIKTIPYIFHNKYMIKRDNKENSFPFRATFLWMRVARCYSDFRSRFRKTKRMVWKPWMLNYIKKKEGASKLLSEPSSPSKDTHFYGSSLQGFFSGGYRKSDYILAQQQSEVKINLHPSHRIECNKKGEIYTSATVRSSKRTKCLKEAETITL